MESYWHANGRNQIMDAEGGRPSVLFTLELHLPRDARFVGLLRNVATCVFEDVGVAEATADDIRLALTEACANAVRHAVGSNEYSVAFTIDADGCTVVVRDLGPGFAFPAAPTGVDGDGQEPDTDTETGRGFMLMSALVDDLQFTRQADATSVTLRKYWPDTGLALAREPGSAGGRS